MGNDVPQILQSAQYTLTSFFHAVISVSISMSSLAPAMSTFPLSGPRFFSGFVIGGKGTGDVNRHYQPPFISAKQCHRPNIALFTKESL